MHPSSEQMGVTLLLVDGRPIGERTACAFKTGNRRFDAVKVGASNLDGRI